jgi:aspartate aminotransferase-like enzyme
MIGHRGRDIEELMAHLAAGLGPIFRTERPVIISTSSATGLMEAAVRNGVHDGVVLSMVNGAFSQRFANIAAGCGKKVEVWEVPWGTAHQAEELDDWLSRGAFEAVTLSHSETSTGALQDLGAIAEVTRGHPGTLLLVDSVTGIGGVETPTDAWGIDFILTGSQKALALPPGLAFGVASAAMMERAAAIPDRGWYFDLVRLVEELERRQTPATPAISLLYALETQLQRIHDEGVESRWKRHLAMQERMTEWVDAMAEDVPGLGLLAPPGSRSPTVSCVTANDPRGVVGGLRELGWVIGGGYSKLRDSTVRIGHMGDHTVEELDGLLDAMATVIR